MTSIMKAYSKHAQLLSDIAIPSFIESHGTSAATEDINNFVNKNYSYNALAAELSDPKNIFHIIYHDGRPAGYSKIIFNTPYVNCQTQNITKLERIYLLQEFYDLKLGAALFQFITNLSKTNGQTGIWLFVWQENKRAINFYTKNGFLIISSHFYKISETHSNPNYLMFLEF